MALPRARGASGARATGANRAASKSVLGAYAALVVAAGCGGSARVGRPECVAERGPIASAPARAGATANAASDAGPPAPPERFYVAVPGECSEWVVANGVAQNTRQGPFGEVVLEFEVKGGTGLASGNMFRRIGPLERIQDSLDSLACAPCFRDRDLAVAYPWQACAPFRPARWFKGQEDCVREAAALASSPDAGSRGGWELQNSVACELSAEKERAHDAEDQAAYDAAKQKLESAQAAMQKRLRGLQTALSRTRHVFARQRGRCEAWDLRQDAESPSGWISRRDALDSGYQLTEFRFAATPDAVVLTGWIQTALPSREPLSAEIHYGSMCEAATSLTEVSERAATFSDQVWFFSRAACEKANKEPSEGFGPGCDRMGH
jgi:hypothetical protein